MYFRFVSETIEIELSLTHNFVKIGKIVYVIVRELMKWIPKLEIAPH